jgi:hypothetical protein
MQHDGDVRADKARGAHDFLDVYILNMLYVMFPSVGSPY